MTVIGRTLTTFAMCGFVSLAFAPASWANNVMPQTLVDLAHANACNPIDEFFDERDPNITNPPYVLGWIPGDAQDSAVFWCEKVEKSDRPYKLLFAAFGAGGFNLASPTQLGGRPAVIEYWNYPRGLRIETQRSVQLRNFHAVTDTRPTAALTGVLPTARVLVSDNGDGLESYFLCYRGKWLVRMLD